MISVIMTAYNVEKYIERAIMSVLLQSYKDLELIIIDDCSTDNTVKIIESIKDKRVRLIKNSKNIGTYRSKNKGLAICKGELITGVGGDDHIHPKLFATQASILWRQPQLVAINCFKVRIDKNGNKEKPTFCWVLMMKREVFERLGYYDSVRFGADSEYLDRILKMYKTEAIRSLQEVWYYATKRKDGLTSKYPLMKKERNEYERNYRAKHSKLNRTNIYLKQGQCV